MKCWGAFINGLRGSDDDRKEDFVPQQVEGIGSWVTAITTGFSHACALLETGEAVCWGGNNRLGELGNGSTDSSVVPVKVVGFP